MARRRVRAPRACRCHSSAQGVGVPSQHQRQHRPHHACQLSPTTSAPHALLADLATMALPGRLSVRRTRTVPPPAAAAAATPLALDRIPTTALPAPTPPPLPSHEAAAGHAPLLPLTCADDKATRVCSTQSPPCRPAVHTATAVLAIAVMLLLGTVIVFGTVWSFFHADPRAHLTPAEICLVDPSFHWTDPRLLPPPPQPHEPQPVESSAHPGPSASPTGAAASAPGTPLPVQPLALASTEAVQYRGHFALGAYNGTHPVRPGERIPRLIHQTWKSVHVPAKWQADSAGCRAMHPDYDYILWTDEDARAFIAAEYPWFLQTFDAYPYNIERADAIRYFVLHHYGGIYMDLDMGCVRPMDPLLQFEVVLPQTKPVGVSNDLMLAAPGHPFLSHTIHLLKKCSRNFHVPYMTIMFSTGPMFLSGAYGQYSRLHGLVLPSTPDDPERGKRGVRILPQILYGKLQNPPPGLHVQPGAFYSHYYGSSWHAGDAGLIKTLGKSGWLVVVIGVCVVGLWAYRASRARGAHRSGWPAHGDAICPTSASWIEMG